MEQKDLHHRFNHHVPTGNKFEKYERIRKIARDYADNLNLTCPDSREKSLAITKLEEVVFWANAAIARNP